MAIFYIYGSTKRLFAVKYYSGLAVKIVFIMRLYVDDLGDKWQNGFKIGNRLRMDSLTNTLYCGGYDSAKLLSL